MPLPDAKSGALNIQFIKTDEYIILWMDILFLSKEWLEMWSPENNTTQQLFEYLRSSNFIT